MTLCQRGKKAAQAKFKVYPSAYANGYAVQVCAGNKPDLQGKYKNEYTTKNRSKSKRGSKSKLARWYKEKWVNICEKKNGKYKPCGRPSARRLSQLKQNKYFDKNMTLFQRNNYPYCRPLVRVSKKTPKTVGELTKKERKRRCSKKRSMRQGIKGKPSYLRRKRSQKRKKSTQKKTCRKESFPWISLKTASLFLKYADTRNVSKVARGKVQSKQTALGFMEAYNKANGSKQKMAQFSVKKKTPGMKKDDTDQTWAERRAAFCKRHTAQQLKNNRKFIETTGKYKGLPTRQETGKIMWACSSLSESQLKKMKPLLRSI